MNEVARPADVALVERLETTIREQLKTCELPVRHHFSQGVYARELFIPKGHVLTGKVHKYENLNILLMGEISVTTEDGVKRLRAPQVIVSPPGTKRAGYAHEDTLWMTVIGTDEKDPDAVERLFLAESYEDYLLSVEPQKKQIEEK